MGDNWAKVELYRWQHGELPPDDGTARPLDISAALRAGAALLSKPETCPTTSNAGEVLRFIAREIERRTADLRRERERATEWEGLAAGRLAALEEARADIERINKAAMQSLGCIMRMETDMLKLGAAHERVVLLERTLRFILRVDKTPFYGNKGTTADKDRNGQLPKKAGTRWLTPRELAKDLNLPAADRGEG